MPPPLASSGTSTPTKHTTNLATDTPLRVPPAQLSQRAPLSLDFSLPSYLQGSLSVCGPPLSAPPALQPKPKTKSAARINTGRQPAARYPASASPCKAAKPSSSSHDSISVSIFEPSRKAINRLCRDLLKAQAHDRIYQALFRKRVAATKVRAVYKEASHQQRVFMIRFLDREIRREMADESFVVPDDAAQTAGGLVKSVDFRDAGVGFGVREVQRDRRRGLFCAECLLRGEDGDGDGDGYEKMVIRMACRNRSFRAQHQGQHPLFNAHPRLDQGGGGHDQPSKPDLSFLKEKESLSIVSLLLSSLYN